MTHTVLRCDTAADLIAVLPRLTGFTDQNSVFLLLFQGKRGNRVLRFSLPEDHNDSASESLAEGMVTLLRESGAGSATPAVVVRTTLDFSADGSPPWQHFTAQLQLRIRREGWRLRELALVAANGWCEFFGEAAGQQRPLSELKESKYAQQLGAAEQSAVSVPVALEALSTAQAPVPRRAVVVGQHLHTLETAPPAQHSDESSALQQVRRVARAADSCFHAASGKSIGLMQTEGRAQPGHGAAVAGGGAGAEAADAAGAGAGELARVIHAAQRSDSWLVIALTALTRAEFVASVTAEIGASRLSELAMLDDQSAKPGDLVDWTVEALLRSLADELPERARLLCAIEVFRDAAAHAPERYRPAVLALLAWAWWLFGLQSVAAQVLQQAHELLPQQQEPAPSSELLELLSRLIAAPPAAHLNQLKHQFTSPKTRKAA